MISNEINPKILETAILEMGRLRGEATFCPSEVVRWLYPQSWRYFMEDIQTEALRLHKEGKIVILQKGSLVQPDSPLKGPIRIKVPKTS
jgi:hypothetical protein